MKRSLLIVALALPCLRVAPRAQAQNAVLADAVPGFGEAPPPEVAPGKPPAGLLFVPGEYIRAYPATGVDLNNFSSRFGLTFPLYR